MPDAGARGEDQALSWRRKLAMVLLYAFSLSPAAVLAGLTAFHQPTTELAVDAALAAGLGDRTAGVAHPIGCESYIERGRYTGAGYRCLILMDLEGRRFPRTIDVTDLAILNGSMSVGRAFGRPGLILPSTIIIDRSRGLAVILLLAILGLVLASALAWSSWRRRALRNAPACSPAARTPRR